MAVPPSLLIDQRFLEVAARSAIHTWAGKEGALSRELRALQTISEAFLSKWLGRWMLARSNPIPYRPLLAAQLEAVVRPALIGATEESLPTLVSDLAHGLKEAGATRGLQTSLVSKFAFSLRPEVIVPYDKRARLGLSEMFDHRIPEHDYSTYLATFGNFAASVSLHLEQTGINEAMRPKWEPIMSEKLFKLRAADKYFMLLGGFSIDRMEKD